MFKDPRALTIALATETDSHVSDTLENLASQEAIKTSRMETISLDENLGRVRAIGLRAVYVKPQHDFLQAQCAIAHANRFMVSYKSEIILDQEKFDKVTEWADFRRKFMNSQ